MPDSADTPVPDLPELTAREREVLTLLAQGHTKPEIAELLGLSVKTVEWYRARITSKLGASSPADLERLARAYGLTQGSG